LAGLRDVARAYPEVRFFGISLDRPDESRELARKLDLRFPLLFDPRAKTIDRYGLRDPAYKGDKLDGVPRPAVFVLDKRGRVRWSKIENDYRERPTNEEIAAVLDSFE
jgi:peroxiredoxin